MKLLFRIHYLKIVFNHFYMQRIYLAVQPPKDFRASDEELYHQFVRVLRSKIGDRVAFFSESYYAEYEIYEITKREIVFVWKQDLKITPDAAQITLFQAIPNRIEKVEYLVQKGVEVGISKFVFFRAERSQPLPLLEKKLDRIRQIVKEALEQSYGFHLPEICVVDEVTSLLSEAGSVALLHTWEDVRSKRISTFVSLLDSTKKCGILVGPEGGFSPVEVEQYISSGVIPVHLGNRILRTETAGLVTAFFVAQA